MQTPHFHLKVRDIFSLSYPAALLCPTIFPAFNVYQSALFTSTSVLFPMTPAELVTLQPSLKFSSAIGTTGCCKSRTDVFVPLLPSFTTLV